MIGLYPGGHLVVGYLPMEAKAVRPARAIRRLIERQRPHKAWAVSTRQEVHGPALYCLFEDKGDADRLAKAVRARGMTRYPGWSSQRGFDLDGAMVASIAASLLAGGEIDERKEQPERSSKR
jgi:hypothetical protein